MTEHEHALELMPGYALGSLNTDESKLVERHAAACPACAQLLKQYQATVGDLPQAIVLYDPPADLKARILAKAAASADRQPGVAAQADPQLRTTVESRPSSQSNRTSWLDRFAHIFPKQAPIWGAVALVVIVLLAVSNALLWSRLNRLEGSSVLRTVALKNEPAAAQAQGTLVISMDGEHGTLVVDSLPPLDSAHQYQLWLIRDGNRTSGGVFSVSAEGYGALWIKSSAPLVSYQAVGVTIEPFGGSPAPTGERVLGGDL